MGREPRPGRDPTLGARHHGPGALGHERDRRSRGGLANSRGLLDYEELVATYWPEFAQNSKGEITMRQLLSHQAGLPAVDEKLDASVLGDLDRMATILAKQRPHGSRGRATGTTP